MFSRATYNIIMKRTSDKETATFLDEYLHRSRILEVACAGKRIYAWLRDLVIAL
jgi:hypothetical protein